MRGPHTSQVVCLSLQQLCRPHLMPVPLTYRCFISAQRQAPSLHDFHMSTGKEGSFTKTLADDAVPSRFVFGIEVLLDERSDVFLYCMLLNCLARGRQSQSSRCLQRAALSARALELTWTAQFTASVCMSSARSTHLIVTPSFIFTLPSAS